VEAALDRRTALGLSGDLAAFRTYKQGIALEKASENTAGGATAGAGLAHGTTAAGSESRGEQRPAAMTYPSCGELMNRSLHGKRSGVVVDGCRDHGLWLDAGELRQLME
jgi:hypothetical protein